MNCHRSTKGEPIIRIIKDFDSALMGFNYSRMRVLIEGVKAEREFNGFSDCPHMMR